MALGLSAGACGGGSGTPPIDGAGGVIDGAPLPDADPAAPDGDPAGTWRSALFPADWTPDFTGPDGNFLHDFSYAGYHRSEVALPTAWPGDTFNVVDYGAVPAPADSRAAFVAAIAAASVAGGIVYVPDGEYRIVGRLQISASGVVLQGQSRAGTKLVFADDALSGSQSLAFVGAAQNGGGGVAITTDVAPRSHVVTVTDASGLAVGDDVLIDHVITAGFIADHGMGGVWDDDVNPALGQRKVFYRREIVAIDGADVTLDAPIRYPLLQRDSPELRLDTGLLRECGLERLSINNAVDPGVADVTPRAHAIGMHHVTDCVIRDVGTYDSSHAPTTDHLMSGGIEIVGSKRVTVADSSIAHAQNHGDGGAGYGYEVSMSSDVLFRDSHVEDVRHGFIQNWDFGTTGVVWLRCDAVDDVAINNGFAQAGRSEFHHRLAIANLFDSTTDTAGFASYNRGSESSNSGHAGTENVFWNIAGEDDGTRASLFQVGRGYVIGTRDLSAMVEPDIIDEFQGHADGTDPVDWLEGADQGATLWPPSLFEAQLAQRLAALAR